MFAALLSSSGRANGDTYILPPDACHLELSDIANAGAAELLELGQTTSGPLEALHFACTMPGTHPAIAIIAGLGPFAQSGTEMALQLAKETAAGDSLTKELRARADLFVIALPSPNTGGSDPTKWDWSSSVNTRPTDDDHDGKADEDGPEDLDGDGVITTMRVADPAGKWRAHPLDPRVLIPVKPELNEAGEYSLYTEGFDNDGDGLFNEDGLGGVDFNRNWTWNYPEYQPGAGPWPVSEPETRAVADFFYAHPEIALVYTLGPQDNLAHPWQAGNDGGRIKTGVLAADAPLLNYISERYRERIDPAGAPPGADGAGSFGYWAYFHYGRWSLMAQPWWVPAEKQEEEQQPAEPAGTSPDAAPPAEAAATAGAAAAPGPAQPAVAKPAWDEKDERGSDELKLLKWLDAQGVDGFAAWTPYAHPDLPGRRVEIGGVRASAAAGTIQAQLSQAGGAPEQQLAFLAEVAGLLPQLSIDNIRTSDLGGGVWRVGARVVNTGYLPTFSAMGELSGQVYPVQATLALPDGAAVVSGRPRQFLPRLDGNGGSVELSWLVTGLSAQAQLSLAAAAPAVGRTEAVIPLGGR
jgi:hypothetical protein